MKADYLSYRRATQMSVLGAGVQLLLGLVFLLYGLIRGDHSAVTASGFVLLGTPVWIALAMVFDQHRRERLEALEAEQFAASDAAGSSVFERGSDDLRVEERKLRFMHRWVLPAVSLGVGGALVVLGLLRFEGGRELISTLRPEDQRGWPMGIGLGSAFVAFVFARYAAVMARQKVWSALRAGAGFMAGTALMGLSIAVGHLVDIPSTDAILRYLPVVFCVLLVLLGAEIFLNFVLDVYRPRKPGEFGRPAAESRLLGFIAAPDRLAESIGEAINYQFGYDVAGSWAYRLLSRVVLRVLVPVALVVLWGMSSMAVIRPHQKGIVLRFGEFSRVIEPGLSFKWPWPIETVLIPEYVVRDATGKERFRTRTVTGVRTLQIGSLPQIDGTGPILWTNDHALEEVFFLVQPVSAGERSGGFGLAQMAIEVPVHYVIDDVEAYERLAPPGMRDRLLQAVAQRELMQYVSSTSVGDLLSDRRGQISAEIRRRIEAAFVRINPKNNGQPVVRVTLSGINGLHPPKDAAQAFENVVVAQQKFNARVKSAEAQAIETLSRMVGDVALAQELAAQIDRLREIPSTIGGEPNPAHAAAAEAIRDKLLRGGGRVAAILASAGADRWERHMQERGRLAAYEGLLGTYRASPAVFRAGMYFDALRQALAGARVFVVDNGIELEVQFDGQDRDTTAQIFDTQQPQ